MSENSSPPEWLRTALLERIVAGRARGEATDISQLLQEFPDAAGLIHEELDRLNEAEWGQGRSIGPFLILDRLGEGGFGTVFRAQDSRLHREVALKVLTDPGTQGDASRRRFQREAEIAGSLDDPAICPIFETGITDNDQPWIAMRLIEGMSLAQRIAKERAGALPRRPLEVQCRYFEAAATALHRAHEKGVVHRDLKPANLMLTPLGLPVILDFGLARRESQERVTQSFEALGTLPYSSPEQMEPGRAVDPRTDIYALGATLFESVSSERPFAGLGVEGLMRTIREDPPRSLSSIDPGLPRDLIAVVEKCLEKRPAQRYATAAELAQELGRIAGGEPVLARRISRLKRWGRTMRRRPQTTALILMSSLMLVAAGGVGVWIKLRLPLIRSARAAILAESRADTLRDAWLALGGWRPAEALAAFTAIADESASDDEALAGRILSLGRLDREADALAELDGLPLARSAEPLLRALRAVTLRDLGRNAEAQAIVTELRGTTAPMALHVLGLDAHRRGDEGDAMAYTEAADYFDRAALLVERARPLHHFERARSAAMTGDAQRTQDAAGALVQLWPRSSHARFFAGFARHGGGDPAGAAREYREALAIEPGLMMARVGLGAALIDVGDTEGGIHVYEEILALDPKDATAHVNCGLAHLRLGHSELALTHYRLGLEVDPGFTEIRLRLARLLRSLDRRQESVTELTRVVEETPSDGSAWLDLAELRLELDDEAGAESALETAQSLFAGDVPEALRARLLRIEREFE
ncbi:MAG: protein kinase [Planctomycetes bacterium]|nr:protein kinase [Planctomycetota bacterium]